MPTQQLTTPYPLIDQDPVFSRVVGYFRLSDCATWASATAAFPFGLWALERLNPTLSNPRVQMRPIVRVGALFGALGGFLFAYQRSSQRFWGWRENNRELQLYRQEWTNLKAQGKGMHGESSLSPAMQQMAAGNSTFAAVRFDAIPWFNVVNHPHHGDQSAVDPDANKQE